MNPPTSVEQFLCFDKKINITSHTISWKKIYSGDSNFEFSKFALMILLMIHHYEKGGKDKLLAEAMWVVISLYLLIQLGIGIHNLIYTHLSRKIDIDQIICSVPERWRIQYLCKTNHEIHSPKDPVLSHS